MRFFLIFSFLLTFIILNAGSLLAAEDGPRTLFAADNIDAIFCGYEASETGDSADQIILVQKSKKYSLSSGLQTKEQFDLINLLKPNIPIKFSFSVVNYYDESGGERMTIVVLNEFKVAGQEIPNACSVPD
ncbi:MAG: hypothetical protein LBT38_06840 [Deltaproteobacteria bacterium]|jgi:hypothetical protein|nr:hypothetical protein [Deltaproteobacteria bacterium]